MAFLVVGSISMVFAVLWIVTRRPAAPPDGQPRYQNHGMAHISNASYSDGGVTTKVEEVIPALFVKGQYASNWQEYLFEPIDSKKLSAAGFGFTDTLINPQTVGSIEGPQTPETVTIFVKSTLKNYCFRVTQQKSNE